MFKNYFDLDDIVFYRHFVPLGQLHRKTLQSGKFKNNAMNRALLVLFSQSSLIPDTCHLIPKF